jgi:uncharacterized OsmC-like protein
MKARAVWVGKRRSVLDNGRGHSAVVDLSNEKGGENTAPSALELALMSLAGCVTTIFSGVAPRRHVSFTRIDVSLEAEQPEGAQTIANVKGVVDVYSDQSEADVRTAFDVTKQECPVGVLFEDAGVKMDWTLNVRRP